MRRSLIFVALLALALSSTAIAAAAGRGQTTIGQWRVLSVMPATSQFWAIDKAAADGSGGVQFTFAQYQSTTTGSFAVYLTHNYNFDLTGMTIRASANWTPGTYVTRGPAADGAYARVQIQDVSATGNYGSNDYWWYTGTVLDLNNASSGTVVAPLADRAHWSNLCGQSATDPTVYAEHTNCVGTTDPAGSPWDGFTNAMKNVKQVNLAFGRGGAYASGVAAVGTSLATFDMTGFTVH